MNADMSITLTMQNVVVTNRKFMVMNQNVVVTNQEFLVTNQDVVVTNHDVLVTNMDVVLCLQRRLLFYYMQLTILPRA
jgi:hypothetical protein